MTLGTILLIILVIALLGGFRDWGPRAVLRDRLLRWRRSRPRPVDSPVVGRDRSRLKTPLHFSWTAAQGAPPAWRQWRDGLAWSWPMARQAGGEAPRPREDHSSAYVSPRARLAVPFLRRDRQAVRTRLPFSEGSGRYCGSHGDPRPQ